MKKTTSVMLCLLAMVASLSASAFEIDVETQINAVSAAAQACNNDYDRPIVCNTTAVGILGTGAQIYSTVRFVLLPGQCQWAYVYSYYPFPFNIVDASGTAECQFQAE